MATNKNYFTCVSIKYYGFVDEELFFAWIKKMSFIKSFEGSGNELYLDLANRELNQDDLLELLAFFKRYKIDMKQLRPFLHDKNKNWLITQKKAFWYKPLFGND